MSKRTLWSIATVAIAMIAVPAWATGASAAGAVNISSCQTLSIPNTVYKLTADISDLSCGDCLVVGANRITIDLQDHSIVKEGGCQFLFSAIADEFTPYDQVVVKNGSVSHYGVGVLLAASTRVSVIGVTSSGNEGNGITTGSNSLVKGSTTEQNGLNGIQVGDRSQVQGCTSRFNGFVGGGEGGGIRAAFNCLITQNTASNNVGEGIRTQGNCTVSYNIANDNGDDGITAGGDDGGSGNLVTHNIATGNGDIDYDVRCPSTVTFNTSGLGFPASYEFVGTGVCHTSNNQ
jgi:hypothetical protein